MTIAVDINQYAERLNKVEVKMEDLERSFLVIAERTDETTRSLERLERKLDQHSQEVGHQLMVLDVGVKQLARRADALEQRTNALEQRIDALDTKIDALDTRLTGRIDTLDTKIDVISIEISRIATHLGVGGAPPPIGHL